LSKPTFNCTASMVCHFCSHFVTIKHGTEIVYTGKIVRLGPNEYSVDDVDALKTIYGPATRFEKAPWYSAFDEPSAPHSSIFSMRSIKTHAQERRKYAAAYSMSTMLSYETHVDQCIDILDRRFREFSSTKQLVNFGHWMQCYAFDVIGKITVRSNLLPLLVVVMANTFPSFRNALASSTSEMTLKTSLVH
jgi:hypothetical protein